MNVFISGIVFFAFVLFLPAKLLAQYEFRIGNDSINVTFYSTAQPHFTVVWGKTDNGIEHLYGFGIRRARLRMSGVLNEKFSVFVQIEGAVNERFTKVIDYRMAYEFFDGISVNAGRIISA